MSSFSERPFTTTEAPEPPPRPAGDWGQASLLLGCVLLLVAPLMMLIMMWASLMAQNHWSRSRTWTIAFVFAVPLLCLLGLSILGLVSASQGMRDARLSRTSMGLPVTGFIVCCVALLFSLINLISCFLIAADI